MVNLVLFVLFNSILPCNIYIAAKKEKIYKCADCKYQTPRKTDLKKHLKRHMGVSNYCCNYCDRTFFDKYNLERHINANHTKETLYSCTKVGIINFKIVCNVPNIYFAF